MLKRIKAAALAVGGNIADESAVFSNGYTMVVRKALNKGFYETILYNPENKIETRYEQDLNSPDFIRGYDGFLDIDEAIRNIEIASKLPAWSKSATLLSFSKSGEILEDLVIKGECPNQRLPIENVKKDLFDKMDDHLKSFYEWNPDAETYYVPESRWVEVLRKHGEIPEGEKGYIDVTVGGSAVSALVDGSDFFNQFNYPDKHGSKYQSAIELWHEKTGIELELKENKDDSVLFAGHALEDAVRKYFLRKITKDHPEYAIRVDNDYHMYQKADKSFVLCDFDSFVIVNGVKGILECKTCQFSSKDRPLWEQRIVPLKYYLQVVYYMACANVPFAFIACMMDMTPDNLVYIYIERDFEVEAFVLKMVEEFVNLVKTGKEPSLEGQDIDRVYAYWRKKMGSFRYNKDILKLDDSYVESCQKLMEIARDIEIMSGEIDRLKEDQKKILVEKFFPAFGDNNKATVAGNDGNYFVTLKNKPRTLKLDTLKIKEDMPDLFEQYIKPQSKKFQSLLGKEYKALVDAYLEAFPDKFNASKFADEHPELVEKYLIPDNSLTETKMNFVKVEFKENKKGE